MRPTTLNGAPDARLPDLDFVLEGMPPPRGHGGCLTLDTNPWTVRVRCHGRKGLVSIWHKQFLQDSRNDRCKLQLQGSDLKASVKLT